VFASPLAFDLDGTLFDNRDVIFHCYEEAGIIPPENFWGQPAREWLDNEEIHEKKNQLYLQRVHLLTPLPPLRLLYRHGGIILTGASYPAVRAIMDIWMLRPEKVFCQQSLGDKIAALNAQPVPGIYIEDQPEIAEIIQRETQWTVVLQSSARQPG